MNWAAPGRACSSRTSTPSMSVSQFTIGSLIPVLPGAPRGRQAAFATAPTLGRFTSPREVGAGPGPDPPCTGEGDTGPVSDHQQPGDEGQHHAAGQGTDHADQGVGTRPGGHGT